MDTFYQGRSSYISRTSEKQIINIVYYRLPITVTGAGQKLCRWVRAILLKVPISCIGTYNTIALTHESNTVESAYKLYWHLQHYCSYP